MAQFDPQHLLQTLTRLPAPTGYWVAYSGGLDSHVLLHALAALQEALPAPLAAVHVNHGLQEQADAWTRHCRKVCESLGLELAELRIDASPQRGESPEARAREARYGAFREWLPQGAAIVSAHHQDDQAETLLLQLLRGSGPKGLGGMPPAMPFASGWLLRPLLPWSRIDLLEYGREQGLRWAEDPSNQDTRFDRNHLRHEILPRLLKRWPAANTVLARSATLCGEAAELLEELAAEDLQVATGSREDTLQASAVAGLSRPRARNLLRHWLQVAGVSTPSRVVLERVLDEVVACRADAEPCVSWQGGEVRRYRELLYAMAPLGALPELAPISWQLNGTLEIAEVDGVLTAEPRPGEGLRAGGYEVRLRTGGERCRPSGRTEHHTVKNLLQEWGVPPWERHRLPLLFHNGELAAIPGYCVCAGFEADAGQEGWQLHWSRLPGNPD